MRSKHPRGHQAICASLSPSLSYALKAPTADALWLERFNCTSLKGDCSVRLPPVFADGVKCLGKVHFSRRLPLGEHVPVTLSKWLQCEGAACQPASEMAPATVIVQ